MVDRLEVKTCNSEQVVNQAVDFTTPAALINIMARLELAEEGGCPSPPENKRRRVNVDTKIDVPGTLADWWKTTGLPAV